MATEGNRNIRFTSVVNLPGVARRLEVFGDTRLIISKQPMGAWGSRSNRGEVTMTTSLQKSQLRQNNILRKIKVEGNVGEGQKVIVRCEVATLRWRGFESRMAIWNKIYERV